MRSRDKYKIDIELWKFFEMDMRRTMRMKLYKPDPSTGSQMSRTLPQAESSWSLNQMLPLN